MYRILVVENHPLVRDGYRMLLEWTGGYTVSGTVSSAEQALEELRAGLPDLVIIDVDLPGMDGFDLVRKLGKEHPGILTVIVSSREGEGNRREAETAGVSAYLGKSEGPAALLDTLARLLSGRTGSGPKTRAGGVGS
jgi:two-component system, NarL family, invasion response regulator UvrY